VYEVYFGPFRCQSEKAKPNTTTIPVKTTQQQPSTWSVDKALTPTNSPDASIDTSLTSQWDFLPISSPPIFSQQDHSSLHTHSLPLHLPESSSEIVKHGIFQEEHSHSGGGSMQKVGELKCTATSGNITCDNYLKSGGTQSPLAPSIPPPMFHEKTLDTPPKSTLLTKKPPHSSPGQPLLSHPIPLSTPWP